MREIKNPEFFQNEMARLKRAGKTIGFVPTMGALHEGHLSLVCMAGKENDVVAVSIFVNPMQFGPNEDLARYPRPIEQDRKMLRLAKADYLFYPDAAQMYSKQVTTVVDPHESLANRLCGKARPGHFRGVCTVISKLFHLAQPDRAYFGQKDYQQATIIRRMIDDLDFGIEMRVLPIVREKDGLAMSSRNRYLSPEERERAGAISKTLFWLRDPIVGRGRQLPQLRSEAIKRLKQKVDRVDYLEIVDPDSLEPLARIQPKMVALAACFVGKTRLIDNVIIHP